MSHVASRLRRMTRAVRVVLLVSMLLKITVLMAFSQDPPVPQYFNQPFPNQAAVIKSIRSTTIPFGTNWGGARYQQVFSATEFTNMPAGGGFIWNIDMRPGCGGGQGTFITNMVVRMSSTIRQPGQLSLTFAENHGADVVTVAEKSRHLVFGLLSSSMCRELSAPSVVEDWHQTIYCPTPYFYDPAKGNLLVEFLIPAHEPSEPDPDGRLQLRVEALPPGNPITSFVYAARPDSQEATVAGSTGMVLHFRIAPLPRLDVTPRASSLLLTWPAAPGQLRLQWKPSLETADWQFVDPKLVRGGYPDLLYWLELPRTSLASRRYYRLFWNSPQIGLPDTPIGLMDTPVEVSPDVLP